MRHLIYIFVIISLSFTVNAQLKSRSLMLEDEKRMFTSVSAKDEKGNALTISPLAIELNEQGVRKALVENNYKEALLLFRRAVDIDSGCFTCRYNLGRSFHETGNLDEAVETFTQLTKAKPDYAIAYAGLGDTLREKEQFTEAIAAYRQALKLENKDAITHCNLAIALHHTEDYKQAVHHFDEAIKLKPNLPEAHSNRGATLYALGRYKDALKSLQKADSVKPKTAEILNNIGAVLDKMGKKKQAHDYFLEAVRLNPEYKSAIYNLALSFLERGDRQAAQQQLKSLENVDFALAEQLRKELWRKYVVDASEVKSKT